jgi:hypothetical protein
MCVVYGIATLQKYLSIVSIFHHRKMQVPASNNWNKTTSIIFLTGEIVKQLKRD